MAVSPSRVGLGCGRIGSFNNPASTRDSIRLIEQALELGVTLFDTANIYGQGDSERAIGRALRGRRDRAFIVTKLGKRFSTRMRLLRPFKPIAKMMLGDREAKRQVTDHRAANIRPHFMREGFAEALESSLRRLRTDHVDALLLHSPSPEIVANPQVAATLARLKQAGKLRHFGVSADDLETLRAALSMPGLSILQLPLALIDGVKEQELLGGLNERGIMLIVREVVRARPALAPPEALRSALDNPEVTSALIGTTSARHLAAAVGAAAGPTVR